MGRRKGGISGSQTRVRLVLSRMAGEGTRRGGGERVWLRYVKDEIRKLQQVCNRGWGLLRRHKIW